MVEVRVGSKAQQTQAVVPLPPPIPGVAYHTLKIARLGARHNSHTECVTRHITHAVR